DGSSVKLSEFKWKSATAGFGKVNVDKNCDGGPLKIDKKVFAYGIGTHAPSLIEYELPAENFIRLLAKAGLDNGGTEQNGGAQVEFMVFTEKPPESLLQISSSETALVPHPSGLVAARESLK